MPGLTLEGFLGHNDLAYSDITHAIATAVGLEPGEVLYVSGSLAEGLGNLRSDIDAFLVTDRHICAETFGSAIVVPLGACAIDIEVWGATATADLLARLELCRPEQPRDPRLAFRFKTAEFTFLHRLSIGQPLTDKPRFAELQAAVDRAALARLLFDQTVAIMATVTVDIAGLLADRDDDSAALSGQRLLGLCLDAILAAHGNTNPSQKWRLRKLGLLQQKQLLKQLPPGFDGRSAYDQFLDRYLMIGLSRADFAAYAHECLRLARHVVPWGQGIFFGGATAGVSRTPTEKRKAAARRRPTPYSDQLGTRLPRMAADAMLRREAGGRLVLSSPTSPMEVGLGELTLQALFYFDGRTLLGETVDHLARETPADREQLIESVVDLRTFLRHYGFTDEARSGLVAG